MLVKDRAQQGLESPICWRVIRTIDPGDFENRRPPLTFKLGQQMIQQVSIENLAVDAFPARVCRADTNSF